MKREENLLEKLRLMKQEHSDQRQKFIDHAKRELSNLNAVAKELSAPLISTVDLFPPGDVMHPINAEYDPERWRNWAFRAAEYLLTRPGKRAKARGELRNAGGLPEGIKSEWPKWFEIIFGRGMIEQVGNNPQHSFVISNEAKVRQVLKDAGR